MQHSTVLGLPHAMTGRPILYRPPQPTMVQVRFFDFFKYLGGTWFQELHFLDEIKSVKDMYVNIDSKLNLNLSFYLTVN